MYESTEFAPTATQDTTSTPIQENVFANQDLSKKEDSVTLSVLLTRPTSTVSAHATTETLSYTESVIHLTSVLLIAITTSPHAVASAMMAIQSSEESAATTSTVASTASSDTVSVTATKATSGSKAAANPAVQTWVSTGFLVSVTWATPQTTTATVSSAISSPTVIKTNATINPSKPAFVLLVPSISVENVSLCLLVETTPTMIQCHASATLDTKNRTINVSL